MNYYDYTKEELISELEELQRSFKEIKDQYDNDLQLIKQAEDKAGKSEEKFRKAYMISPDAVNINRLSDGMYVSVNSGFTKILGYTENEVIGKTSLELNIWADSDTRKKLVDKLKEDGIVENFDADFRHKNDNIVKGLLSASLIDLDGVPHILTVTKDITDRKNIEDTLLREQFLVKALMDNLTDHIYFKDLNSRFIRINKAQAQFFALEDPAQAVGKSDFDFFTGEHANQAFEDEQNIIRTGIALNIEEKETNPNGTYTWVSTVKSPLYDIKGSLIGTFGISRDITEQKRFEEQSFLLANALMSTNECVSITDMNDILLFANQTFLDTYGFRKEEIINKSISLIRSSNNPADIVNEIAVETVNGGWQGELVNRKKDGTEFMILLSTAVVKNEKGIPIAMIGVANDITERKKAEEALKQSEERYRSVMQSANDAIITSESKGIILGWNPGAEKIFGYCETEILGQSLNVIIPGKYLDMHIRGMQNFENEGEKKVIGKTVELDGLRKDGNVFPLELSLSEWETAEGKFFTGIIRDISQRRRTELENKTIYEITKGVMITSNLDELLELIHRSIKKIMYADNFFIALFDYITGLFSFPYFVDKFDTVPKQTAMEKTCTAYVMRTLTPFLFTQEAYDKLIEQKEVEPVGAASPSWIGIPLQTPSKVIGVLVLQHYEKENVYSESDVNLLLSIGSQIAIAIERKKVEEEVILKNGLLQTINAEKDKFFSILAHDLRGPLSAFVAATQIITEEIQTMSLEEIKEITESMKLSATNIYGLLENLLEWSRLKRGGMDFIPEKLDLKKKIEDCIDVLSESARKKRIEISVSITDHLDYYVDNHMFDSIIRNLITNAIKFTSSGGKVSVSAYRNASNFAEINISDTGIGMTTELKNKLFLINEKTSRNGTEGELSTGLGLLLCKEFIEKHEGTIWVESEVGKGSTFFFTIGNLG